MKTKACSSSSWADTGPLPHMHQLSYLSRKPQKRHSWSRGVTVVWCCFLISLASCLAFFLAFISLPACLPGCFDPLFLVSFLTSCFFFLFFSASEYRATHLSLWKVVPKKLQRHTKSLMVHGCLRQKSTQQILPTVLPYSRAWIQKRSRPALKPQKSLDAAKM